MYVWKAGVIGLCGLLLVACATDPPQLKRATDLVSLEAIEVPAKFDTTALTPLNLSSVIRSCLPWLLTAQGPGIAKLSKDIPSSLDNLIIYGSPYQSGNLLVMSREQGFCVQRTSTLKPILAAEFLNDTVQPIGVPASVLESWNKQIAKRLAVLGSVRVAYAMPEGIAYITDFWFGSEHPLHLNYRFSMKAKGRWENDLYDMTFAHPSATGFQALQRGVSATNSAGVTRLEGQVLSKTSPLDHRFLPQNARLRP